MDQISNMEESLNFETLGQKLRKARLDKNKKIPELSDETKIQIAYLKKMELGEFDFFPKPIIIGFIKSYVLAVEGNPTDFINDYEACLGQPQESKQVVEKVQDEREETKVEDKKQEESPPVKKEPVVEKVEKKKEIKKAAKRKETKQETLDKPDVPQPPKIDKKPIKSKPKKQETWFHEHRGELLLGALVLIILIAIIYVYIQYVSTEVGSTENPVEKITVFEARQQNLAKSEDAKSENERPIGDPVVELPSEPEPDPIEIPEKVKLRVVAAESTWVHMVRDEADTNEYIFPPGRDRSFEANEKIELRMGRADGLFLWVNSDSIGVLGTAAEIVSRLVLTSDGITERRVRQPQVRAQQNL